MSHYVDVQPVGGRLGELRDRGLSRLVTRLRADYYLGKVGIGDRLPPVRELARQLHVSPTTALNVYRRLEDAGLVETRERSGIFVRGLGAEPDRTVRQLRLFEILGGVMKKLDLLRVSPSEFSTLLLRYSGADPRDDFKFGFLSHVESRETLELQLQACLFKIPIVQLPLPTNDAAVRAHLARDRSVRCLLTTYLYSPQALALAKDFNVSVILVRLVSTTARILEPPETERRYIVTRDPDFAAAFRRLACDVHGSEGGCRIVVAALGETDRLKEIERDATEVYASPLCIEEVRRLYGASKDVRLMPTAISDQTLRDILFHYVFESSTTR